MYYIRLPVDSDSDSERGSPVMNLRRKSFWRRHCLAVLLPAVGLFFIVQVVWSCLSAGSQDRTTSMKVGSADVSIEPFLEKDGWIPFGPEKRREFESTSSRPFEITPIASQRFSHECLDDWIAKGAICDELRLEDPSIPWNIDLIWTYVGVSELLSLVRSDANMETRRIEGVVVSKSTAAQMRRNNDMKTKRRFRDHGELKSSMRSVQAAFAGAGKQPRNLHLLTTDLPAPSSLTSQDPTITRIGQVPTWIDQDLIAASSLKIHHHSNFFKSTTNLPLFNSKAIESQIGNLMDTSDYFVYMNDDFFFTSSVSVADFASPWTGPVFRIQKNFGVNSVRPGTRERADGDGEWKGLEGTNWILEERFGRRSRAYVAHVPKTVSMPVFKEAGQIWAKELEQTAEARFRGNGEEITPMFLATHFQIERHREALLWSYLVARADFDHDGYGYLSLSERQRIIRELGVTVDGFYFESQLPLRSPPLSPPADSTAPLISASSFSSSDGFAFATGFEPEWPAFDATNSNLTQHTIDNREIACRQSIASCFGEEFITDLSSTAFSTNEVFKRVAFKIPSCGDCLILKVKSISGRGLEAFLPVAEEETGTGTEEEADQSRDWEVLSLDRNWEDIDFTSSIQSMSSLDLRRRSISLIQRYSYTMGAPSGHVIPIAAAGQLRNDLSKIDRWYAKLWNRAHEYAVTFLVLNDDIVSDVADREVSEVLTQYFEMKWGNISSSFEKAE